MKVKDILIGFVGGAAIGAVVMRIVDKKCEKHSDKMYVTIRADELDDLNDQLGEARADAEYWHKRFAASTPQVNPYTSHSEDPIKPEEFDLREAIADNYAAAPEEDPGDEMDIYAIAIGDFMQDAKYAKKYLVYYKRNGILANADTDTAVDDAEAIVGDMIDIIENYTGNLMYIRNTRTGVDYQIDFEDAAYDGGGDA